MRHAAEDANDEDVQFVVQEVEPVLRGQLGYVFLFGRKSKKSTVLQRWHEPEEKRIQVGPVGLF